MGVNKVILGSEEIVNLTDADVTSAQILSGAKAYDQNGDLLEGSCPYDTYTGDADATDDDILFGKTAYVGTKKKTGRMPNNGSQVIKITNVNEPVAISTGYHDGAGYATISDTDKDNLVAGNIKAGIWILGVEGTMTGEEDLVVKPLTITPKTTAQSFAPATLEADYFGNITVEEIKKTVTATGNGTTGTTVTIGQV